jgi:tetratricopeptide (TPR) repeat protein
MAPTKGRQSTQQDYQLSRNYPVDKERAKGSCLVLPGSQRRKSRGKEEEQQRSLLGGESPASASTQLTAWTTTTETNQDDVSDMFSEDPFSVSKKQIEKERGSSVRRRGKKSSAVSHEELLMAPKPSERSRRKNYDGEQEPEGVRGQEAVVAKPLKQSPTSDTGDVLPGMRSFSEPSPRRSSNNDSLRLVSPEENKPRTRKSSRRHKDSIEDKQEYEVPDGRSPRLSLLPVTETSIPEGVEETSTEDDESSSHEGSLLKSSFVPDSKLVSVDEYSPQDVRDFRGSSVDIRKHSQGRPQSSSVSPPTPRMRKLPDGPERDRPSSTPSLVSASYSSDDLKEMMPDLMPIPQSSQVSTGRARSTSRHMGPGRLPGKESHSNDTFEANYINSLDHVEGMNAAAVEHVENGEYDLALAAFEQVLAAYKEIHGDAHPLVASTYHNLGMVHSKRAALLLDGTFHQNHCRQQSLECFQAAARSGRDSLGPNHPNVAVSLVRIGFLLLQARQYQNAFVTFKEALRIRLAHYGRESPHSLVANLYNNLGVCKMHMGEYKEGSSFLKTALEIQRKVLRIKRQEVNVSRNDLRNCLLEIADTLCNLGGLYLEWIRQQGPDPRNATEAESAFSEALEVSSKHEACATFLVFQSLTILFVVAL